jgi:hypothetical protein
LVSADLDMHKAWFHTDGQGEKIVAVQTRYGDRVKVETYGQEHMFSIESRDPTLDVREVVDALDLVNYDDYISRCTAAQERGRIDPPVGRVAEPAE